MLGAVCKSQVQSSPLGFPCAPTRADLSLGVQVHSIATANPTIAALDDSDDDSTNANQPAIASIGDPSSSAAQASVVSPKLGFCSILRRNPAQRQTNWNTDLCRTPIRRKVETGWRAVTIIWRLHRPWPRFGLLRRLSASQKCLDRAMATWRHQQVSSTSSDPMQTCSTPNMQEGLRLRVRW